MKGKSCFNDLFLFVADIPANIQAMNHIVLRILVFCFITVVVVVVVVVVWWKKSKSHLCYKYKKQLMVTQHEDHVYNDLCIHSYHDIMQSYF